MVHKQRGKPGEMGKAVAIPPDKEAEKKEMFKVIFDNQIFQLKNLLKP